MGWQNDWAGKRASGEVGTTAYKYFVGKGLAPHQAAAAAANLAWEGGGSSSLVSPFDNPRNSPNAPHSVGIGQWNDRSPNLFNFARQQGIALPEGDLRDQNYARKAISMVPLQTQLDFMWNEFQGPEKRAYQGLTAAGDLKTANASAIGYHRPAGWTQGNPYAGHSFDKRQLIAQRLLDLNKDGQISPEEASKIPASAGAQPLPPTTSNAPSAQGQPQMFNDQKPGFLTDLAQRTQTPMFMGGLSMFLDAAAGGSGVRGLQAGTQSGSQMLDNHAKILEMRRQQASRNAIGEALKDPNSPMLAGVPQGLIAMTRATQDPNLLMQHFANAEQQKAQIEASRANTAQTQQQTQFAQQKLPLELEQARAATSAAQASTANTAQSTQFAQQTQPFTLKKLQTEADAAKIGRIKDDEQLYVQDATVPGGVRWLEPPSGGDAQAKFKKAFAAKAPEMWKASNEAYAAADDALFTAKDMEALAPHIYSGTWANADLNTAKFLNDKFGTNFAGVAPTELFITQAQKFIGAEGQKYKPLSNSDIGFIEKGVPNITKDKESIPHILAAMKRVAERDKRYHELLMDSYSRGNPPNVAEIKATVNKELPSYVENMQRQKTQEQSGNKSAAPVVGAREIRSKKDPSVIYIERDGKWVNKANGQPYAE